MFSQISVGKGNIHSNAFSKGISEIDEVPKYAFEVTMHADVR